MSSVTPVTRSPLVPTPDNSDPIGIKLEVLATVIVELVFVLITSLVTLTPDPLLLVETTIVPNGILTPNSLEVTTAPGKNPPGGRII